MFIQVGGTHEIVQLSFSTSSEREIELAPGLTYEFTCIGGNGWYGKHRVEITYDMSLNVHSRSLKRGTWILMFKNFSESDEGRYSCSGDYWVSYTMSIVAGE